MYALLDYGRWDYAMTYLDDILIFSSTFDDYKKHLHGFYQYQLMRIFNHIINEQLIKPNGEKIKAITERPAPRKLKEAN
ncbi:unnamed protein product [Rotaria sp. Silwood1]|nr:unnamed protein product [Rotaria sp. Silwood1]